MSLKVYSESTGCDVIFKKFAGKFLGNFVTVCMFVVTNGA